MDHMDPTNANAPGPGGKRSRKDRSAFDEHLRMVGAGAHPLASFDTDDYLALLRAITLTLEPGQPVFCCLSRRGTRSPHPPPQSGRGLGRSRARCPFCHPEDYLRHHS